MPHYRVVKVASGEVVVFFLMIRRPPRSTLDRSSAASDVYKRQTPTGVPLRCCAHRLSACPRRWSSPPAMTRCATKAVSYTHLRAHETVLDLVCRLLLEKNTTTFTTSTINYKHITPAVCYRNLQCTADTGGMSPIL